MKAVLASLLLAAVAALRTPIGAHAGLRLAGRARARSAVAAVVMLDDDKGLATDGDDAEETRRRPRGMVWARLRERLMRRNPDGAAAAAASPDPVVTVASEAVRERTNAAAEAVAAGIMAEAAEAAPGPGALDDGAAPAGPVGAELDGRQGGGRGVEDGLLSDGVLTDAKSLVEDIAAEVQTAIDSRRRRLNAKLGSSLRVFRDDVFDEVGSQASAAKERQVTQNNRNNTTLHGEYAERRHEYAYSISS